MTRSDIDVPYKPTINVAVVVMWHEELLSCVTTQIGDVMRVMQEGHASIDKPRVCLRGNAIHISSSAITFQSLIHEIATEGGTLRVAPS